MPNISLEVNSQVHTVEAEAQMPFPLGQRIFSSQCPLKGMLVSPAETGRGKAEPLSYLLAATPFLGSGTSHFLWNFTYHGSIP